MPIFIPLNCNIYLFWDKINSFMINSVSTKNKPKTAPISLNWQDSTSIQALLDVIVGVMAEEYAQVARENENVFKKEAK